MANQNNTENAQTIENFIDQWEREKPKIFSPEQLQDFTSNFSIHLGSGSFGDVFQGIYNGEQVAVKVLKEIVLAENIKDQFMAEVSTLGKTHHRNLVKLYGFCFQPNMKALVYEFMEMGSLDKILHDRGTSSSRINWETLCGIAIGIAKGLSYLHEGCHPSVIHYDIKPSNVLLDSNFIPKIGDFGLAKLLMTDRTHVTMFDSRGTPYYCAPELSLPYLNKVNHKCDVYSYGMMLFDIVSMRKHQSQEAEEWFPRQVYDKYEKGTLEEVMADCIEAKDREMAKKVLMIALSCIEFLASNRPSMMDVLRLLEGTKELQMPSNHFLSSLQTSSSAAPLNRDVEAEDLIGMGRIIMNPNEGILCKVEFEEEVMSFLRECNSKSDSRHWKSLFIYAFLIIVIFRFLSDFLSILFDRSIN